MAVVDQEGRLFGRLNLVDAFIALIGLALIPLGYGAYVLFRTPPPRLTAVEPATLQHGPNLRITIRGEHLRPYMRVSLGDHQGMNFLFYSATTAEVELGDITPGTYDVVLYDYAQERARLPQALTISPPPLPSTEVDVVGAVRNLTADMAKQFTVGLPLPGLGSVVQMGHPVPSVTRAAVGAGTVEIPLRALVDLPVIVRAGCYLQSTGGQVQCVGGGVALVPDAFLLIPTPWGKLPFQVDQVRATTPLTTVEARVRFIGDPGALALLKPGDVDAGVSRNELAAGATVLAAEAVRRVSGTTVLSESQVLVGDVLGAREVTLRVPAQSGVSGWRYAGEALRVGGVFLFRTPSYELRGSVLRVLAPAAQPTNGGASRP